MNDDIHNLVVSRWQHSFIYTSLHQVKSIKTAIYPLVVIIASRDRAWSRTYPFLSPHSTMARWVR